MLACLLSCLPYHASATDLPTGRKLYVEHCAACHGTDGDGRGPLAPELTKPPADLRRLSKKYGIPLAVGQIARFMDGREDVKAHGPRDMPVWGWEMWQNSEGKRNPNEVSEPVAQIIGYLQSIQVDNPHVVKSKPSP